jgi:hypothetical protein
MWARWQDENRRFDLIRLERIGTAA